MDNQQHWAIIGGGLLGLTLAWDLAGQKRRITILEAAATPGGLAAPWRLGDIVWDRHYHVTLLSDASLRELLAELSLEREIRWKKVRTGFFVNGRLHPFSTPADFVRFPLLNPWEKLLFGTAVFRASRLRDPKPIESLTVEQWLTHLSGKSVFRKLWRPLLRAKLGDDYQTTSATFIWATIQRLYAARRSGLREELFGYLPGGYARMLDAFAAALRARGVELRLNSPVTRVERSLAGPIEVQSGQQTRRFDRVIVTVPAPQAARLCPTLTTHELELMKSVDYEGIICVSVLLRRPLSEYYITNIVDNSISLTGVIEMSALVDPLMFGGRSLVYLPRYLHPDDPAFLQSDEQIEEQAISSLQRMHPSLRPHDILTCRTSRVRYVFPRPNPESARLMPPIDVSVPGLHIVNAGHIPAGTLNVNETVHLARSEARRLQELAA